MAALTPVSITLPDSKIPTKKIVRDIVGTFLTKDWPFVEPETIIMTYHSSFANAHCIVERPQLSSGKSNEDLKVFIKSHKNLENGPAFFKDLMPSRQEEAIFCYEYGKSGLGAKVYGFFQTQDGTLGRIDEFLDARNLEPEDVEDATIRADIAKGMAVCHTLEYSLKERTLRLYYKAVISGLKKLHRMDKLKTFGRDAGVNIDKLVDYDFVARLIKVLDKMESIGAKPG